MFRYADPQVCPGCRAPIAYSATRCESCDLVLTGWSSQRLFTLLSTADAMLAEMRVQQAALVPAGAIGSPPPPPPTAGLPTAGLPTAPPLPPRPPQAGGLSAASVPRILLSLGALCLVVASMVFLAVTWAALGVEGRTLVVVVLTGAAAGTSALLARRELRGGAEAFAAVALALLALDVTGADAAGWLGDLSIPGLLLAVGAVVTPAGLLAALAARSTPIRELAVAEVAAGAGAFLLGLGLATRTDLSTEPGVVLAMLLAAALTVLADDRRLRIATGCLAAVTVLWWAALMLLGGFLLSEPTFADVWAGLDAWPMLVAIAAVAAAAGLDRFETPARAVLASVAVGLAAYVLCFPVFDESPTSIALVELAVVAGAGLVSVTLARPWRWVTGVPAAVAGLGLAASAVQLLAATTEALLALDPWGEDLSSAPFTSELDWSWPLLLPTGALGAAVAAVLLLRCVVDRVDVAAGWWIAALLAGVVPLVPVLYGVPLWGALAVLTLAGVSTAGVAAYTRRLELAVPAVALAAVAFVASFADEWTTAIALALATVGGLGGVLRGRGVVADVSGMVFLPAMAGFLWTVQHLADVDTLWRAIPIVLVAGAFAIGRPGPAGELPSGLVAGFAITTAVVTPAGWEQGWLAAYLTLAGVLVSVSALVHQERRELGWVAGALFTAAQWLRLEQLGVETAEAYTLPLALALLVVGLVSLRRPDQSTSRALGAGLGLALVPTLLQVLVDPLSGRALILGLACLALVLAGARLRWSAPLVAGASVGTLVVLREAAHAQLLPQWMVIGAIGIALTVLGVTWEQRLAELRRAAGYLRALR